MRQKLIIKRRRHAEVHPWIKEFMTAETCIQTYVSTCSIFVETTYSFGQILKRIDDYKRKLRIMPKWHGGIWVWRRKSKGQEVARRVIHRNSTAIILLQLSAANSCFCFLLLDSFQSFFCFQNQSTKMLQSSFWWGFILFADIVFSKRFCFGVLFIFIYISSTFLKGFF